MNTEALNILSIFSNYQTKTPVISGTKTSGSFANIFRDSLRKNSLQETNPAMSSPQTRIGSLEEADQLTELEDKYCSMCGSRIKEDGTCPICIVPIFISGNQHSPASGASQPGSLHAISGNRAVSAYRHRKG